MEIEQNIKRPYNLHVLQQPENQLESIQDLAAIRFQDTNYLCSCTENQLQLWKLPHYSKLCTIGINDNIQKISFIPSKRLRLLVTCLSGYVYEYDFQKQIPVYQHLAVGGAIWDTKIKYSTLQEDEENKILLASEDGSVRIYKSQEDESRIFLENTTRNYDNVRCLCVAWLQDDCFVAGYQNSVIRKFDKSLNAVLNINVKEASEKCFTWTLDCIDQTIVAGCSDGHLKIFESEYGTGLKQIKTHQADITCVQATAKGIYATGVDSKIVLIQKIQDDFQITSTERGQSHDIKALLVLKGGNVISGGLSTDIAIYRLDPNGRFQSRQIQDESQYKQRKIRHITNLPQQQMYFMAEGLKNKKVILVQQHNKLQLVQLQKGIFENLLEINTQDQHIVCSQINQNSSMIAYSTLQETSVFLIKQDLSIQKIQKLEPVQTMIIKDQKIYYINFDSQLCSFDLLTQQNNQIEKLKKSIYNFQDMNNEYIVFGSKIENQIIVLKNDQVYFKIPQVQGFINGFTNFSLFEQNLWIVFDNNKFLAFDLAQKQMTEWSLNSLNKFPNYYLNHYNKLTGIFQVSDQKVIVYCPFFYSIIELNKAIPKEVYRDGKDSKQSQNFQLIRRNNPILFFKYSQKELIVIENTWQQLLKDMPGAVNTRNFGF